MDENKKDDFSYGRRICACCNKCVVDFTIYEIYVVGKMIYYKIKNLILAVGQML